MGKAVELINVSKRYGSRTILDNINITVNEREMIALVGVSGSGKSTLLNMIGLLENYDSGKIKIKGEKLPKIESRQATLMRRNVINYLFQSFALINDMTVFQNLLLAMNFQDIPLKEKKKHIDEILQQVNLIHLKNEVVNRLSGGEQQRIALARTILKPGDIVLADEPTGALDEKSANNAFNLIRSLCKSYGKTVIMVTHSLELAQKTDRIIDLNEFRSS